jgi:carboxymethylenebutenolidase
MSTDDAKTRDYLVTPEVGRGPGVLLLHSGRGLTDFVRRRCHRLAREGFVALAPDLFEGETPSTVGDADALKAAVDEDRTARRLEDVAEFLRRHESVSRPAVGLVGVGYGAEWACRLAAGLGDDCGALVVFYGVGDPQWASVSAPVLGHFAQLDHEFPRSRVNELRTVLGNHDVAHDLFVYGNTEPSFFETDETARHDPEAAGLAWERTLHFLRSALHEDGN